MIIVMTAGATEDEADAVRTQIRAHGLTPHDNVGTQRVVIAVLGDVAPVREHLMSNTAKVMKASHDEQKAASVAFFSITNKPPFKYA